uniref:Integrase catalytic domain-containing protein n=1 Tax=Tanacetum cinerariifolium TaxID=118510 RepID=A0A6L2KXK8_TANCI|nr:hypothetical protein [Tanacetum cinerariifolium]
MEQPNPTFAKIPILDTAPQQESGTGSASESSAKKKGMTIALTTEDIHKRRNDVKARTTLLLALPDEHQLRFSNSGKGEVNTASIPTSSIQISPASADVAAASISHDTIDEDDIEEMDIKWNMALLSMRADRFWKKTGKKITIQGWDWSYMANEEENHALASDDTAPTEFTLMAKSSSSSENEVFDNSLCFKSCKKNTDSLNTRITNLKEALSDSKTNLYHYKLALSQVEARLIEFKTQDIKFCEKIRGLEFNVKNKNIKIENLMNVQEQIKKEQEGLDSKLTGFESASKDLDTLLGSQRSDKNNEGLGYHIVPPSLPAQIYSPPKKDMSWTGLPEFNDDTITDYSRPSPSIKNSPTVIKTNKVETVRKPSVKYAEMYRNTLKSPKASVDESMLWYRRLGHLNFKTMNKLVRHNLVKDETSGILRNFITEIENQKELKVKIIRCDNGGEFKNTEMNEFCTRKGIKREFSNARTSQQNRVAKRRNRTLIEAAKTMLADAKLPVIFGLKQLTLTLAIGFLKPFGCHVMILNTLDHLGKFDAKGDEGYFIGYSMSSIAFRVFNKRTKKVEENLHVDFLENKLIEKGAGLNWLFDIDTLTNSTNYVPVMVAGTSSTNFSSTKEVASQDVKKDVSSLRYIALLNCGNSNPTATSKNPSADQMETLTVESAIPTVSSPVPH